MVARPVVPPDAPPAPVDPAGAEPPSKSQRKRDMTALQKLGIALADLPPDRLAALDIPEPLREALAFARRVTSHEGRRRHLQYIGKLMRTVDPAPLQEALDAASGASRAAVAQMHEAEHWRERLIADDDALTALVAEHPGIDVQQWRARVRAARRERDTGAAPRQARALYQDLHALLSR